MKKYNHITDDNVEGIAPTLFAIGTQNAFKVPEGYFEMLPQMVLEKCMAAPVQKRSFRQGILIYMLRPQTLLVAASMAAVMLFGTRYYTKQNVLAKEDIMTTAYLNELDESVLEEGLVSSAKETKAEDDAATEYLLEHNVDPAQISN